MDSEQDSYMMDVFMKKMHESCFKSINKSITDSILNNYEEK